MQTSKLKKLINAKVFFPERVSKYGINAYRIRSETILDISISLRSDELCIYFDNGIHKLFAKDTQHVEIFETKKEAEDYLNTYLPIAEVANKQKYMARQSELEKELKKVQAQINQKSAELDEFYNKSKNILS